MKKILFIFLTLVAIGTGCTTQTSNNPIPEEATADPYVYESEVFSAGENTEVYLTNSLDTGTTLYVRNTETGEETTFEDTEYFYDIYAIPQENFDGRVFLYRGASVESQGGGTDAISAPLFSIDINTVAELTAVAFENELPFVDIEAVQLSPNQTYIAALYDNIYDPELIQKHVVFYDLLTGEMTSAGTIAENEYFSEYNGSNTFGGSDGYDFSWKNDSCIHTHIYTDQDESTDKKVFVENREFCLEK